MIIPGVVSVTFRNQTADWVIEKCQRAGLKAVEWSENIHVFPDDEAGAAALYQKTAEAGLQVAAYGSYYRLGEQAEPELSFARSLKSAAALNASIIRVWAGDRPSAEVEDDEYKSLAAEAALIAEMAAGYKIKVAFEWHRNTLTDTNESAMRLLELADHPNLYCLWQPTLLLSMEERVAGIRQLGDRLLNLHVYYWPEDVRRPLAEGIEVWKQYLQYVDDETDRYGLLEFVMGDSEEQFLADAKVWKEILEKSSKGAAH